MRQLLITAWSLCMASTAFAQWSDDPALNMLVPDGGSSPAVTHCASDGTGGCWVTWYDASNGYDVLLQHIDAAGVAHFAEPILVDDQSLSWVQDFELTVDSLGRAAIDPAGDEHSIAYAGRHVGLVADCIGDRQWRGGPAGSSVFTQCGSFDSIGAEGRALDPRPGRE